MSGINFNSLFGNTGGLAGMLGDYQAIKSGSYAKLMKSYYGDAKKSLAEHPAVQRQAMYLTVFWKSEEIPRFQKRSVRQTPSCQHRYQL